MDLDLEIPDRALHLGMTQKELNRAEVAGPAIDHGRLGSTQRVRAVVLTPQADASHPLVDEPGILPGADVSGVIGAARKSVVIERATSTLKP